MSNPELQMASPEQQAGPEGQAAPSEVEVAARNAAVESQAETMQKALAELQRRLEAAQKNRETTAKLGVPESLRDAIDKDIAELEARLSKLKGEAAPEKPAVDVADLQRRLDFKKKQREVNSKLGVPSAVEAALDKDIAELEGEIAAAAPAAEGADNAEWAEKRAANEQRRSEVRADVEKRAAMEAELRQLEAKLVTNKNDSALQNEIQSLAKAHDELSRKLSDKDVAYIVKEVMAEANAEAAAPAETGKVEKTEAMPAVAAAEAPSVPKTESMSSVEASFFAAGEAMDAAHQRGETLGGVLYEEGADGSVEVKPMPVLETRPAAEQPVSDLTPEMRANLEKEMPELKRRLEAAKAKKAQAEAKLKTLGYDVNAFAEAGPMSPEDEAKAAKQALSKINLWAEMKRAVRGWFNPSFRVAMRENNAAEKELNEAEEDYGTTKLHLEDPGTYNELMTRKTIRNAARRASMNRPEPPRTIGALRG